jgi:hypothetical protein
MDYDIGISSVFFTDFCQWGTEEDDKGYAIATDLNNNIKLK